MQIKRRIFSYPVLNSKEDLSTYGRYRFELRFETEETEKSLILKDIHYFCDSEYVNKKIRDDAIKVFCIVECSETITRRKYLLSAEKGHDLILQKKDLSDKTDISMYAIAGKDFVLEPTEEFDEDYQGTNFEIEKNNFLCVNDGFNFRVVHKQKEDNFAKSIFSVIPIEDSDLKTFDVEVKTNKIEISMSRNNYNHYSAVQDNNILAEEFFCVLLVPALSEALFTCKEYAREVADIDDIEAHYKWFASVTSAYKALYGMELQIDEFKKMSSLELAQKLLGAPLNKALIIIEDSHSKKDGEQQDE